MFVQHKSEYINLNHIVKLKKTSSITNQYAHTEFSKITLTLSTGESLTLDFNSEDEMNQWLTKIEIKK